MDQPRPTSLSVASVGNFVCTDVEAMGQSQTRMKSLGICAGRTLELVSAGDPMIVRVGNSRIGLSRALAASVSVCKPSTTLPRKAK
jgi:Fe2+ transport system protein FeoA